MVLNKHNQSFYQEVLYRKRQNFLCLQTLSENFNLFYFSLLFVRFLFILNAVPLGTELSKALITFGVRI